MFYLQVLIGFTHHTAIIGNICIVYYLKALKLNLHKHIVKDENLGFDHKLLFYD